VQLHSGLAERGPDRGVVLEIPGQPVELVDHEAVDARVLGQTGKHGLELRPVGGAGGLTWVDVFVGELPAAVGL
jgi:hypothetical protein